VDPSSDVVLEPYEPFWFKIAGAKLQKNGTSMASDQEQANSHITLAVWVSLFIKKWRIGKTLPRFSPRDITLG
jgi:hypothetical protein